MWPKPFHDINLKKEANIQILESDLYAEVLN